MVTNISKQKVDSAVDSKCPPGYMVSHSMASGNQQFSSFSFMQCGQQMDTTSNSALILCFLCKKRTSEKKLNNCLFLSNVSIHKVDEAENNYTSLLSELFLCIFLIIQIRTLLHLSDIP
jgi:hypothetical protein